MVDGRWAAIGSSGAANERETHRDLGGILGAEEDDAGSTPVSEPAGGVGDVVVGEELLFGSPKDSNDGMKV